MLHVEQFYHVYKSGYLEQFLGDFEIVAFIPKSKCSPIYLRFNLSNSFGLSLIAFESWYLAASFWKRFERLQLAFCKAK